MSMDAFDSEDRTTARRKTVVHEKTKSSSNQDAPNGEKGFSGMLS